VPTPAKQINKVFALVEYSNQMFLQPKLVA
jgi:hypothetical protein